MAASFKPASYSINVNTYLDNAEVYKGEKMQVSIKKTVNSVFSEGNDTHKAYCILASGTVVLQILILKTR